jgi:hypothetical protein
VQEILNWSGVRRSGWHAGLLLHSGMRQECAHLPSLIRQFSIFSLRTRWIQYWTWLYAEDLLRTCMPNGGGSPKSTSVYAQILNFVLLCRMLRWLPGMKALCFPYVRAKSEPGAKSFTPVDAKRCVAITFFGLYTSRSMTFIEMRSGRRCCAATPMRVVDPAVSAIRMKNGHLHVGPGGLVYRLYPSSRPHSLLWMFCATNPQKSLG